MKKTLLTIFSLSICLISGLAQNVQTVTVSDELEKLYNISLLPKYMPGSVVAQVSTFDTTGGNEDGFSGKYSYIRRNADSSLVIFDIQGPGVITRIWTPTPTEDSFDFYFDNSKFPNFSIKYSDLFSGNVFPFEKPICGNQLGGYFNYFPILFQKNCRIVCRGKQLQFHQIQYKLYPKGTVVKTFDPKLGTIEKAALDKAISYWSGLAVNAGYFSSPSLSKINHIQSSTEIGPGETKMIFSTETGGRIMGILLDPAEVFDGIYKSTDIRITWDDEKVPAVDCPVADFFGYAFGKSAMQSLLLGTAHSGNYCFFPMPFDRKAVVQLINRKSYGNSKPVKIKYTIYISEEKRDVQKEGKFYSCWNRNTKQGQPHVFLNRNGRGHYVGTLLQAQGLKPGMTYFFEGDDSTSIDGQMRLHGTGSEDYFNGGWYALADRWDSKMSLPLHGCLDYSLPFSRTGGYRLYLADKISFERNIFQSIEHGPQDNLSLVDYTSLAFYYADSPPESFLEPADNLTQVEMPDTLMLYPQLMYFGIQGSISSKPVWKYNTGGLSYAFTTTDESGLKISLAEIPFGRYRLLMDWVQNDKGCSFSVWQGQSKLTEWISAYHAGEKIMDAYYLADLENNSFKNAITIHFKTTGDRDHFILNRFIFVRRTE